MLADASGMDEGSCSWVLTMTTIFVLGFGLNFIKVPLLRKWYSSTIGLFFGFYVWGIGYVWVIAMFVSIWPVMLLLPKEEAKWVGNGIAVIFLTLSNIYVFFLSLGKTDFVFAS